MSPFLLLWFVIVIILTFKSLQRPIWGVAVYMQCFYAFPPFWWWGKGYGGIRFSLIGGSVLLVSVLLYKLTKNDDAEKKSDYGGITNYIAAGIVINATFVHLLLAENINISSKPYFLLLKFVLLYFLIVYAVQTKRDFKILLLF